MFAFQQYVLTQMGKFFVEGLTVNIEQVYKDTNYKTPMIFILSTGADPTNSLLTFAKKMGYDDRLDMISLGQGQDEKAKRLIGEGK